MGAGITKDSLFARWFGQQAAPAAAASASSAPSTVAAAIKSAPPAAAPAASIPLATWALFVCRDVFTIGAGFVLPDMVSRAALAHRLVDSKAVSDTVAQLTVRHTSVRRVVALYFFFDLGWRCVVLLEVVT